MYMYVGSVLGCPLQGLLDVPGGHLPRHVGDVLLTLGHRPAAIPLPLLFGKDGAGHHELGLLAVPGVCRGAHVLQAAGGQLVAAMRAASSSIRTTSSSSRLCAEGRRYGVAVAEVVLQHGVDGPDYLGLVGRVVMWSAVRRRIFRGGHLSDGRDEVEPGAAIEGELPPAALGESLCVAIYTSRGGFFDRVLSRGYMRMCQRRGGRNDKAWFER